MVLTKATTPPVSDIEFSANSSQIPIDNMANITFLCPHCNRELSVPFEWMGQTVTCPGCQKSVPIPNDGDSAGPAVPKFTLRASGAATTVQTVTPSVAPGPAPAPASEDRASAAPRFTIRTSDVPPSSSESASALPSPVSVQPAPVPVAVQPLAVPPPIPASSAQPKVVRRKKVPWGAICGVLAVLILAGGGLGFYCYRKSNQHFLQCQENLKRYAEALRQFTKANGYTPWGIEQLDKYLGERPECPASKKSDSYVLLPSAQAKELAKLPIPSETVVLLCVHGSRAAGVDATGNVTVIEDKKRIQELLAPAPAASEEAGTNP